MGISFETAAGQIINIFSFDGQSTPPTGNAYGELTSNPSAFGVGHFTLTAVGFAGIGVASCRATQKGAVAKA